MKMKNRGVIMTKTSKISIPPNEFRKIEQALKSSGVKFYPFTKTREGYEIEFSPQDHPLVSFLILKYDNVRIKRE